MLARIAPQAGAGHGKKAARRARARRQAQTALAQSVGAVTAMAVTVVAPISASIGWTRVSNRSARRGAARAAPGAPPSLSRGPRVVFGVAPSASTARRDESKSLGFFGCRTNLFAVAGRRGLRTQILGSSVPLRNRLGRRAHKSLTIESHKGITTTRGDADQAFKQRAAATPAGASDGRCPTFDPGQRSARSRRRDRMAELNAAKKPRRDKATDGKALASVQPRPPRQRSRLLGAVLGHSLARPHRVAREKGNRPGATRGRFETRPRRRRLLEAHARPRASRRYTDEPDARRRVIAPTPRSPDATGRLTKTRAGPRRRARPAALPRAPLAARPAKTHPFCTKTPLAARQRAPFFHEPRQRAACSTHAIAPISPQKNHPFFYNAVVARELHPLPDGFFELEARDEARHAERPALPDAPVFRPTAAQFRDPLRYVASIRREAEPFGICKIVPPRGWKVESAVDWNTTKKFAPRDNIAMNWRRGQPFDSDGKYTLEEYRRMADRTCSLEE